jgi:hypothetical protein
MTDDTAKDQAVKEGAPAQLPPEGNPGIAGMHGVGGEALPGVPKDQEPKPTE